MARTSEGCEIDVESMFGPIVADTCYEGFDFTLLFEETILSIAPSAVAIAAILTRSRFLAQRQVAVRYNQLYKSKIVRFTLQSHELMHC